MESRASRAARAQSPPQHNEGCVCMQARAPPPLGARISGYRPGRSPRAEKQVRVCLAHGPVAVRALLRVQGAQGRMATAKADTTRSSSTKSTIGATACLESLVGDIFPPFGCARTSNGRMILRFTLR